MVRTHDRSPRHGCPTAALGVGLLTLAFCGLPWAGLLKAAEPLPLPPATSPSEPVRPVTIADVMAMSQSGLDDQVMINLIRQNGMASALSTAELISLRRHGVSNAVIAAMQSAAPPVVRSVAPPAVQTTRAPLVQVYEPAPVVIHRYAYPRPVLVPSYSLHFGKHWHHHHRPSRHTRSGTSVGFGVTFR